MDAISRALRRVIWRKRTEYLDEAVRREIITDEQAEALHLLRLEIDDQMDRREEQLEKRLMYTCFSCGGAGVDPLTNRCTLCGEEQEPFREEEQ